MKRRPDLDRLTMLSQPKKKYSPRVREEVFGSEEVEPPTISATDKPIGRKGIDFAEFVSRESPREL